MKLIIRTQFLLNFCATLNSLWLACLQFKANCMKPTKPFISDTAVQQMTKYRIVIDTYVRRTEAWNTIVICSRKAHLIFRMKFWVSWDSAHQMSAVYYTGQRTSGGTSIFTYSITRKILLLSYMGKDKGTVPPITAHEGPEREQTYSSTLPSTSALVVGWVVSATLRPLYPRERPGTHCIGGWVVPRAGLDGCRKLQPPPHRDSIPGPSSL